MARFPRELRLVVPRSRLSGVSSANRPWLRFFSLWGTRAAPFCPWRSLMRAVARWREVDVLLPVVPLRGDLVAIAAVEH